MCHTMQATHTADELQMLCDQLIATVLRRARLLATTESGGASNASGASSDIDASGASGGDSSVGSDSSSDVTWSVGAAETMSDDSSDDGISLNSGVSDDVEELIRDIACATYTTERLPDHAAMVERRTARQAYVDTLRANAKDAAARGDVRAAFSPGENVALDRIRAFTDADSAGGCQESDDEYHEEIAAQLRDAVGRSTVVVPEAVNRACRGVETDTIEAAIDDLDDLLSDDDRACAVWDNAVAGAHNAVGTLEMLNDDEPYIDVQRMDANIDGVGKRNYAALGKLVAGVKAATDAITQSAPQKRARKSHDRVRKICAEQMCTDQMLPVETFNDLIREVAHDYLPGLKFEPDALRAIQEATESHLVSVFEHANLLAIHAGREEVRPCDLQLARRIRGDRY